MCVCSLSKCALSSSLPHYNIISFCFCCVLISFLLSQIIASGAFLFHTEQTQLLIPDRENFTIQLVAIVNMASEQLYQFVKRTASGATVPQNNNKRTRWRNMTSYSLNQNKHRKTRLPVTNFTNHN